MSENKVLFSVPRPIFEWSLDYGTIRVFHLGKNIVTITFDHNLRDETYGQVELQGTPHFDAISLVYQAVYNYHTQIPEGNPFIQLLEEPEAMEQLAQLFQKIWSGEDNE
jgi:hypothetical protein